MSAGKQGDQDLEQVFFGPDGLLNDSEEKAMQDGNRDGTLTAAFTYREPAGHAPPEKPAKFYVVYTHRLIDDINVQEFDNQHEAEQYIVKLRGQVNVAKPVIFYGHMSRPQVKQHVTYTVEHQ